MSEKRPGSVVVRVTNNATAELGVPSLKDTKRGIEPSGAKDGVPVTVSELVYVNFEARADGTARN